MTIQQLKKNIQRFNIPCSFNGSKLCGLKKTVVFLSVLEKNVRYVAAKIKFDQNLWKESGFDISGKPEILATLYNISSITDPHKPHAHPDSNDFGKGVALNYKIIKRWLNI